MFNLSRRKPQPRPALVYPKHYEQTARQAPGDKCEMSLVDAAMEGEFVTLVYRWALDLSHEEADRLDTRARAYIACAIYDAATIAGLSCQPGPPHASRPSWHLEGERMPVSLVNAGFDTSDKTCFMVVGPCWAPYPQSLGRQLQELISGFLAQFSKIEV